MPFSEMIFLIYSGALDRWFGLEGLNVMGIPIRIGEGGVQKKKKKSSHVTTYSRQ